MDRKDVAFMLAVEEANSGGHDGGIFGMSFAFCLDSFPVLADDGVGKIAVALVKYIHRALCQLVLPLSLQPLAMSSILDSFDLFLSCSCCL
mmetsp:Transcript_8862/g.14620  ORF Transcript_8862/g.14620 Transcript_8862/m.14620 type:complete len:91 (-) Transcript_8862:58-330(-)